MDDKQDTLEVCDAEIRTESVDIQAINHVMTTEPKCENDISQILVWIQYGTSEYRNAGIALFLLGFSSFSLIYCVQPLLPIFARSFQLTPVQSSLALSLTTGFLAVSIFLSSALSQTLGRRGLMFWSMLCAVFLNMVVATVPSWNGLLIARALEGVVLGGVPAVAMAWISEEIDPAHLGKTMGLYVSGTAFGAMMGRVGMGIITEFTSWQMSMILLGVLCLITALGFFSLLPPSRNFMVQRQFNMRSHLEAWGTHLHNPHLRKIYVTAFILTGIFVTLFNYATFRLSDAPYSLSPTAVSMIFLTFAFGIVSSSVSGILSDRFGYRSLLMIGFIIMLCGILLTLHPSLVVIAIGIACVTTGFFIAHSVASGSIGALAGLSKGHATALYLLFYYMGSSIIGSVGGWFWQHGAWFSIVLLTSMLTLIGMGLVFSMPQKMKIIK